MPPPENGSMYLEYRTFPMKNRFRVLYVIPTSYEGLSLIPITMAFPSFKTIAASLSL